MEIDIIEGVHVQTNNLTHLHTRAGCQLSRNVNDVSDGHLVQTNCDAHADGNAGCGFEWNSNHSYGKGLSDQQGGVVVMNCGGGLIHLMFSLVVCESDLVSLDD